MAAIRVIGLVTAAGLSSRMGAFKPLLPFRDSTVIECAVGSLLAGGAERAVAVTGFHANALEAVLTRRFSDRITAVRNPDYAVSDMMRSVKIGCAAMPACDAFFLLPGDMPLVESSTVRSVIEAFSDKTDAVFPTLSGKRKHPPLIAARLIPAILGYDGDDGLRGFFNTLSLVREIAVSDPGTGIDLDTPDQYRKYVQTDHQQEKTGAE